MSVSLAIEACGVRVAVTLPAAAWRPPLAARYAAFLTAEPAAWRVRLICAADIPSNLPGEITHEAALTRFHIGPYRGWIELAERRAEVTAPSEQWAASALERTLAFIFMQALPREMNALWLHAAGVVLDGRGWVFFGRSGAGKTTIAGLAAGHAELLNDENVIVQLTPDRAKLHAAPFWGHSTPPELIQRQRRSAPLAALCALVHGEEFALRPLSPGEAATALLETEKVATERVESALAWLAVAERLVQRVPVYLLTFPPSAGLWAFLRDTERNLNLLRPRE